MTENNHILDAIYGLKPGERATITVEFLEHKCKSGVKAAITTVSESDRKSREQYFQVVSASRVVGTIERLGKAVIDGGETPEESI